MLPQKSNCAWIFRIGKLTNAAATRDIKKLVVNFFCTQTPKHYAMSTSISWTKPGISTQTENYAEAPQ